MSLNSSDVLATLRQHGLRLTIVSIVSTISLGIIDQFTSKIIPSVAQRIENLFDPPRFIVTFSTPVDISAGPSVSALDSSGAVPVKVNKISDRSFAALAGPGAYELRLQRKHEQVLQELVATQSIEKSKQIWLVDSSERNWANAAELRSGPRSSSAPGAEESRLSATRWSVTEQDFVVLAAVQDSVLRSILANALAEVGVFEKGTEREQRRILSYWAGIMNVSSTDMPWSGAFLGWAVKQAGAQPPRDSARVASWRQWDEEVPELGMSPGMVAVFQPNTATRSGLAGIVLRRQPSCIEVVMGNIVDRVVISCVRANMLVSVRRPAAFRAEAASAASEPAPKGE